jgi:hypothetical protein
MIKQKKKKKNCDSGDRMHPSLTRNEISSYLVIYWD